MRHVRLRHLWYTAALDPTVVGEVLDMVRELVRETGFARGISTSVAFLHEGRIASGVRQNTSCVTPTSPRP